MKKIILPISIILGCIILGVFYYVAQTNKQETSKPQVDKTADVAQIPRYSEYSIGWGDDLPKINKVDLSSHPKANMFRTTLKSEIGSEADFAFYYKVAIWGCGSSCQSMAIIDSRDGKIYFPDITSSVEMRYEPRSKLLVVHDPYDIYEFYGNDLSERPDDMFTSYYVWENNDFRLIKEANITYKVEDVIN